MNCRTPIYMERQRMFSNRRGTFGPLGSIAVNGCGAIAVYNILAHFGISEDFMKVIRRFEHFWPIALPFGGVLGSNLFFLYFILRQYGFHVYPIFFFGKRKRIFRLERNSAILFFYGWRKKWGMGAHYQAGFSGTDGQIVLHNPHAVYHDIEDLLRAKKERENMWFCMALHIKLNKRR